MDTVITSLLSSDLFLIETPSYTGTISASQVNYVSTQFPKIYSLIGANAFNVLEATTNVLSVQNPKGQTVSTGVTAVDGAKVSIALSKKLPVGKYTVRWRIVSADGHPLAGRYSFTIRKKR